MMDTAKILEANMDNQPIVAEKNMEALVSSLVDQHIALMDNQSKKAILQSLQNIFWRRKCHQACGKPNNALWNKQIMQDTTTQP
jgi:hypothetical protein